MTIQEAAESAAWIDRSTDSVRNNAEGAIHKAMSGPARAVRSHFIDFMVYQLQDIAPGGEAVIHAILDVQSPLISLSIEPTP